MKKLVSSKLPACMQSLVAIAALCNFSAGNSNSQELTEAAVASTLEKIIQTQATDWNRGDIERFMRAYWNSEQLTFLSGGEIQRGWNATRARYFKRYPTRETMGRVSFSKTEVQLLGPNAALMLGRWRLDRADPIGGNFTLVWRQIDGTWLIVHDHTSVSP